MTPDIQAYVVVPAAKLVASIYGHQVDGAERAHVQLKEDLRLIEMMGVSADGEVGVRDPMQATKDALSHLQPDLILVSTLPSGLRAWFYMDLQSRLRRRFGIKVEQVLGKPVDDNEWQAPPEPIEGAVRILLVEDSPAEAHLMRHALAESRVRIDLTVVGDGSEALEELRRRGQDGIDLVLLDLRLPHIDGHRFLEIVGEEFDVDSLNVTVVSGSADSRDRERAYALGAGGFVVKDADLNVFTESVGSVLRGLVNAGPL